MHPTSSNHLYCCIRKVWVKAFPEESVRQELIKTMVTQLGFPPELIAVEVSLGEMHHLHVTKSTLPKRRADIVCYSKEIDPHHILYPLLLVECKAIPLKTRVLSQVIGYNYHIQAHFIAVVNANELRLGWFDSVKQSYQFIDHLPTYIQLKEAVKKKIVA